MKKHIAVSLLLLALTALAGGQPPENLTVEWRHFTTRPSCEIFSQAVSGAVPCDPQEGVWVAIFVSDPEIEALSLTLNYRDSEGRDLSRTELLTRWYRDRAAWTNHLFVVGGVKVVSILVTPLKPARLTKLVTVTE